MKKRILIILLLSIIILTFSSCSISDKTTAERIDDLCWSDNNDEIIAELKDYLDLDNNIIQKYYQNVFECDEPEEAYAEICATYDSALLQTGKYDLYKTSFESHDFQSDSQIQRYFEHLWQHFIFISAGKNGDSHKIIRVISEQSNNIYQQTFLYYLNSFYEIENNEGITKNVISSKYYEDSRIYYILPMVTVPSLDKIFVRMVSNEYINEPFTGTDLYLFAFNNNLTDEQKALFNEALENLKKAYLEKKPKIAELKISIIENIQEKL